jgi:hypothetical protein
MLHKSRSHTLDESGSIRQPVTQDSCADVVPSFKHCRSPASQPRIPAIKSSIAVLSPRLDFRKSAPLGTAVSYFAWEMADPERAQLVEIPLLPVRAVVYDIRLNSLAALLFSQFKRQPCVSPRGSHKYNSYVLSKSRAAVVYYSRPASI